MAVNYADGTLFVSLLFYPIAAMLGAMTGGARLTAPLFVVVSFPIGLVITHFGRKLLYWLMQPGIKRIDQIRAKWIQQIAAAPMLLLYIAMPNVIIWSGVFGTWYGCHWLARYLI